MYEHCFKQLPDNVRKQIHPTTIPLIRFSSERSIPEGIIHLETTVGSDPLSRIVIMEFHVVKSNFKYPVKDVELAASIENMTTREIQWEAILGDNKGEEKMVINDRRPDQPIKIGKHLPHHLKNQLVQLLANSQDVLAWMFSPIHQLT
ncbi:reverse transcriptase domain-containing protein [Artemisia annua]|uniref:Reverse transcriptase domain-containing protein n=1 Tax=Artemisia annua TaxID=35608 RepID=A0A2U1Q9S0_ARTAN|nr:reverse transcriptase domain-containing protein [Artemisia annua]